MTFEDIFGGFDDFSDNQPEQDKPDEWDAGGLWDTGEKENIWRTAPAVAPGDVWKADPMDCGQDCEGCEDECGVSEEVQEIPEPPEENYTNPEPDEYDSLDEYDDFLDEEVDVDESPSDVFGDIF